MDLNEPYLKANFEYMKQHPTDYLTQMSAPDEMAPAPPPFYVNGQNIPQIRKFSFEIHGVGLKHMSVNTLSV